VSGYHLHLLDAENPLTRVVNRLIAR